MWSSESLPVVSYNKTRNLLSTSLLQLISIGLCHYEVCVGSDENNTFFGGKYPLVSMLLGKLLSYFLSLTEIYLLIVCGTSHQYYSDTNRFNHPKLPNRTWVRHSISLYCQVVPSTMEVSRICSNKNIPFLDWYSYTPNYAMQNSQLWQLW